MLFRSHATIETAVEATRIGAMAFLEKPITLQKLLQAVEKGLSRVQARPPAPPLPTPPLAAAVIGSALAGSAPVPALSSLPASPSQPESALQSFDLDVPLRDARDAFEKAYFEYHLAQENGSMTRVADKTGLERTHLYRKLRQLGVDLAKTKRSGN